MKRRVLVTGGAGFIGSHVVDLLVAKGHAVTVVDDLSRGSRQNIRQVKNQITFYKADLRKETPTLQKIFTNQDVVINLAALNTGVDFDEGRTERMFEENMLLQMMPLRLAQAANVKKFIQISSASVYSRQAMEHQVPTPETADTTNPEPSKLGYGLAKLMGENLARWYATDTRLKTVIVRFINVYGPRDNYDKMGHFIPVMIKKFITAKNKVVVFGSGKQRRSFLDVRDAARAVVLLVEKGKNGEVYNVDAHQELSVRQVVEKIGKHFSNKKPTIIYDTTKPEGSQRRLLDSAKLQTLGWQPKMDFEVGLHDTIEDIKSRIKK